MYIVKLGCPHQIFLKPIVNVNVMLDFNVLWQFYFLNILFKFFPYIKTNPSNSYNVNQILIFRTISNVHYLNFSHLGKYHLKFQQKKLKIGELFLFMNFNFMILHRKQSRERHFTQITRVPSNF